MRCLKAPAISLEPNEQQKPFWGIPPLKPPLPCSWEREKGKSPKTVVVYLRLVFVDHLRYDLRRYLLMGLNVVENVASPVHCSYLQVKITEACQ